MRDRTRPGKRGRPASTGNHGGRFSSTTASQADETATKRVHLAISVLGTFAARLDGESLESFESNKSRLLLAYLACNAGRPHRREYLAELFWPNRPESEALSSLRFCLSKLRATIRDRSVSPPFLEITRRTIQLSDAANWSLDVDRFHQHMADSGSSTRNPGSSVERKIIQLEAAIGLCRGPFLEDLNLEGNPELHAWVGAQRQFFRGQFHEALVRLAEILIDKGEWTAAERCIRKQLELDAFDEQAHCQLMRVLALRGQRAMAIARYDHLVHLLDQEMGVPPSDETQALYRAIAQGDLRDAPQDRPLDVARAASDTASDQSRATADACAGEPGSSAPSVFVARDTELARLDEMLQATLRGQGGIVFVTGEAGSGKTALVTELARRAMSDNSELLTASGRCLAHTGFGEPYLPFREVMQLLAGSAEPQPSITREHARRLRSTQPAALRALAERGPRLVGPVIAVEALMRNVAALIDTAPESAWVSTLQELTEATGASSVTDSQDWNLSEQIASTLLAIAEEKPILIILDDLQWADDGSIDLLFHLGKRLAHSRILVVGTFRVDDVACGRGGDRHPLTSVLNELQRDFGDIVIDLMRAGDLAFVEALIESMPARSDYARLLATQGSGGDAGSVSHRVNPHLAEVLHHQTGGNPLFAVELMHWLTRHGVVRRNEQGQWLTPPETDWDGLPKKLEAVLGERIGRLPALCRTILTAASIEGETFTAEVVASICDLEVREVVRQLSGPLVAQGLLRVRGASRLRDGATTVSQYQFWHALFQRYLYASIDKVERLHLHEAAGNALESLHAPHQDEMALHLAWHFEKAELFDEAVDHLLVAGRNATRMAAHKEAIAVLTRALGLLRRLPDSRERLQKELLIQSDLVIPLQVLGSYGTPERGHANQRAFELGLQIGDAAEQYEASVLQCSYLVARARYDEALTLGEQLFDLARQLREPAKIASAHLVVGLSCLYRGQLARARIHLEQALAGYDPEHHRPEVSGLGQDLGVLGTSYLSWVLWLLGHPDQALQCSQDAVSAARRMQHPFSIGFALGIAGSVIRLRRGEYPEAQACAEELLGLWEEHSFALYQAWGWCVKGHALIEQDSGEEGIALLEEGVRACESLSIIASHSQQLVNLADGFRKTGQTDEGLRALAEAMRVIEEHDERHFEAEAHRVKGELLRQRGDDPAAVEECFQRALDVARSQKAASWELRSATSLSRLWHHQGRTREAHRLLTSAYALFSEGMATEDLRKARNLLDITTDAATIEEPRPAPILRW